MAYQRRQVLQALSCAVGSSFILPQDGFAITHQDSAQAENPSAPAKKATEQDSPGTQMEKVAGIGGFFFRAHDPAALARWYQQHLGIALTPAKENDTVWQQEAGATSFTPFPERTGYFGDPQKMWMINFRVHDLGRMAAQLQHAGIEVKVDAQSYSYGRFASLHDPEGNPIQLWQPA